MFKRKTEIMNKPTKQEFENAKNGVAMMQILQFSIPYKTAIQTQIIPSLTQKELEDIRDCRLNQNVIDRLCQIGAWQPNATDDLLHLYACAMAIGTIIKEYEWGLHYVMGDGLYDIALKINENK